MTKLSIKILFYVILVLGIVVLSCENKIGYSIMFSVTHYVSENTERPIGNIHLDLIDLENNNIIASCDTKDSGGGKIEFLDEKEYILRIIHPPDVSRIKVLAPDTNLENLIVQQDVKINQPYLDINIPKEWETLKSMVTIRKILYYK